MKWFGVMAAVATLGTTQIQEAAATRRPVTAVDRIARVSREVFGPHARTAECIAHFESTDGAHLYNGANLGPWQTSISAHPWVNRRRVVHDWLYSARVAYVISDRGTDWRQWSTHGLCGV